MWKFVLFFIWESIVGKDVRLGKAIKYHKIRIIFFLILCISLFYNYISTERILSHYNYSKNLEIKYLEQKKIINNYIVVNSKLQRQNDDLEDTITKCVRTRLKEKEELDRLRKICKR